MNSRDLILIEKANQTYYTDWANINPEKAESIEGKERLKVIRSFKCKTEEFRNDNQ